jgi:hypothetical protein
MTVGVGLGGRGVMGFGLGRGRAGGADVSWWLAGGISAANAIAAYQPKGAASLAASYVNLANPGTYDAAPGVAPTFNTSTGWTFNGTTQYLTSGVTPATNYTIAVRYANLTADDWLIGAHDWIGGGLFGIDVASWGGRYYNTNSIFDGVYTAATKILAWDVGYTNGATVGTVASPGPAPAFPLFIGARNARGAPDLYVGADVLAVAIYDNKLGAAQVAAVSAAMAAL